MTQHTSLTQSRAPTWRHAHRAYAFVAARVNTGPARRTVALSSARRKVNTSTARVDVVAEASRLIDKLSASTKAWLLGAHRLASTEISGALGARTGNRRGGRCRRGGGCRRRACGCRRAFGARRRAWCPCGRSGTRNAFNDWRRPHDAARNRCLLDEIPSGLVHRLHPPWPGQFPFCATRHATGRENYRFSISPRCSGN